MNWEKMLDFTSVSAAVGSVMGWLPPVSALFAIVWLAIQIYESSTVKKITGRK